MSVITLFRIFFICISHALVSSIFFSFLPFFLWYHNNSWYQFAERRFFFSFVTNKWRTGFFHRNGKTEWGAKTIKTIGPMAHMWNISEIVVSFVFLFVNEHIILYIIGGSSTMEFMDGEYHMSVLVLMRYIDSSTQA